MYSELARTVDLIYKAYPQAGIGNVYGERVSVCEGVIDLYRKASETLAMAAESSTGDCVVFGWAGIGDAVHDRLIIQHLAREHQVTWLTTPQVAPLYKDDTLCQVIPTFSSPYRDARQTWLWQGLCGMMDALFAHYFPDVKRVHVSHGVANYWHKGWKGTTYPGLFFGGVGVERDNSIVHQLTHNGKPTIQLPKHYVVCEHASITFGTLPQSYYEEMARRLKKLNIATVVVGAPNDPPLKGAIDARGLPLYDTFSLMKGAAGFVGRSSGNQSMMVFLRDIPLFQVQIPDLGDFELCKYHPNVYRLRSDRFADFVEAYFRKNPCR
jgi:hypothetical protein